MVELFLFFRKKLLTQSFVCSMLIIIMVNGRDGMAVHSCILNVLVTDCYFRLQMSEIQLLQMDDCAVHH